MKIMKIGDTGYFVRREIDGWFTPRGMVYRIEWGQVLGHDDSQIVVKDLAGGIRIVSSLFDTPLAAVKSITFNDTAPYYDITITYRR